MKELSCFCTLDFKADMRRKDILKRNYILPNYSLGTEGRIQKEDEVLTENDQVVRLALERFQIPELLFNPTDGLIPQCGLHEAVHEAILRCNPVQQPILYRNIMAIGGNIEFPNFRARMLEGIRGMSTPVYTVYNIYTV